MKILLDTHIWLWWLGKDKRLPRHAKSILNDRENTFFLSAATIWEIVIKHAAGRLEVAPAAVAQATRTSGIGELPVTARHALRVSELPPHHRDPFDRMLVAQSIIEPMRLLTHDEALAPYGETILLV